MYVSVNFVKLKFLGYFTFHSINFLTNRMKCNSFKKKLLGLKITSFAALKENSKSQTIPIKPENMLDIRLIINEADKLYKEQKLLQVYDLLIKFKYSSNTDILWRLCRVLYKLSYSKQFSKEVHMKMLNEGLSIISEGLTKNQNDPELYKWNAILLDAKAKHEGVISTLKAARTVKKHLMYANILNPDDKTVLYMLGYWCYQMSSLTWLQRKISNFLWENPPECTYDEAYNYFLKADSLPPSSVANTFMLGKVSLQMGQYFRASYYLHIVANMQGYSENDRKLVKEARKLAKRLDRYDLTKNALVFLD